MPPAVDHDTSNTLGNPERPNIPPDLPPNFRHWNRDHVKRFLEDNKDEYGLDKEDIDLIYESKIRGRHFPKMTLEMLVKDYQLPRGAAVSIQELITFVVNPPQFVTPDLGHIDERPPKKSKTVDKKLHATIQQLCDALTAPFPDLPDHPTADQVDKFLGSSLITSIPYIDSIPLPIQESHPYLIPQANHTFSDMNSLIGMILLDRPVYHGEFTEDCYHCVWDNLIMQTLFMTYRTRLDFLRYSTDKYRSGTTADKTRPDFLCWMRGALVLRGEEKSATENLEDAYMELSSKFGKWSLAFYGQLPFIFAYATSGTKIQFCLLTPDGRCQRLNQMLYDAGFAVDRLSIFRTTINIVRFLRKFESLLPPELIRLYTRHNRPDGVTVTIYPSEVIKRVPTARITEDLYALYSLILAERPPYIVNFTQQPLYGSNKTSLHLYPVGFKPRPCEEAQLRRIIQDVLQGLKWLHNHDYVHRDIRWDNIIIDKNGRAHLIDLEYAGKAGAVNFKLEHWPPAAASFYPKTADLYLVGQLMNTSRHVLEDSGLVFMQKLIKEELDVEDALSDAWLQ
ncbi:hypothetical protein EV426DRAFT_324156 [Tirmania nivea]|nr:hypothetical protein EV426DRAFT_324156 [Tirmania nivea]